MGVMAWIVPGLPAESAAALGAGGLFTAGQGRRADR